MMPLCDPHNATARQGMYMPSNIVLKTNDQTQINVTLALLGDKSTQGLETKATSTVLVLYPSLPKELTGTSICLLNIFQKVVGPTHTAISGWNFNNYLNCKAYVIISD